MHTFAELMAQERTDLSEHGVISIGGYHKPICPLCPKEHRICHFDSGSSGCTITDCSNPHHR